MGKKAKFKKIRRIAAQLPVVMGKQVVPDGTVRGFELKMQGVKTVQGKEVDDSKRYQKRKLVEVPINHNRKMKKLYNKFGAVGVNYVRSGCTKICQ